MRQLLILLPTILLLATAGTSQQVPAKDRLHQSMVELDQAFIPVWMYTYEGNIWNAKQTVFNLAFEWQQIYNRYGKAFPQNEQWALAMERSNDWLGDAFYAIDDNCAELAFNQLEHVKYELQAARKAQGIDYYLDDVYDFHAKVEALNQTTNDELLGLLEWQELETETQAVIDNWERLTLKPFDPESYAFNAQQMKQFVINRDNVGLQLDTFKAVMEAADREELAIASENIERALLQWVAQFGSFDHNQDYYAYKQR